jgi:hypothetical protein
MNAAVDLHPIILSGDSHVENGLRLRGILAGFILLSSGMLFTGIALADKIVGSCQADVTGAVTATIVAATTADQPDNERKATAMTTIWMKAKAESPGVKGTSMEQAYVSEASSPRKLLMVRCSGQEGSFSIGAPAGATPTQYPEGAKNYRLVGQSAKEFAAGDLVFIMNARVDNKWTNVTPKDPGQLKITRNDKQAIAGNFKVSAGVNTVTGSFSFRNADN